MLQDTVEIEAIIKVIIMVNLGKTRDIDPHQIKEVATTNIQGIQACNQGVRKIEVIKLLVLDHKFISIMNLMIR